MRDTINKNDMVTCELNANCDTLSCEASKYHIKFKFLPCLDSPSFHVMASSGGDTIHDDVISSTASIPIMAMTELVITLKHVDLDSTLKIKVSHKLISLV